MEEHLVEEFLATARSLVGKTCWKIVAGTNTGSVIDLHLGKKLPIRTPIHPTLATDPDSHYQGELGVFIECAWRLDAEDEIICGWGEDFSAGSPLSKGLHLLLHQAVERVCIRRPALDLSLHFSNSLVLRVFCDQTEPSEDNDNYVLFTPRYSYVVSTRSKVIREERSELELP